MRMSSIAAAAVFVGLATHADAQSVCDSVLSAAANYTDIQVARNYVNHMQSHMCRIDWTDQTTMQSHAGNGGIDFSFFEITVGGTAGWSGNSGSRTTNYNKYCTNTSAYRSDQAEYQGRFVDNKFAITAWSECAKSKGVISGLSYQDPNRKGVIISLVNYTKGAATVASVTPTGPSITSGDVKCDSPKSPSPNEAAISCSKEAEVAGNFLISSSWGNFGPFTLDAVDESYEQLKKRVADYENRLKDSYNVISSVMNTDPNADIKSEVPAECPADWEPIHHRCSVAPTGWDGQSYRRDNGYECLFDNNRGGLQDRVFSIFVVCGQRAMK